MLQQEIIYQSEGKIWRLLLDEAHEILVLELRFEDLQEVCFSAFDLAESQLIWEDFMLEETWWISTHTTVGGKLYLSEWEVDAPISKSVIAIDLLKGEGLWQKDEVAFISANKTQVLLQTNFEGDQVVINAENGEKSSFAWMPANESSQLLLPSRYTEDLPYFQTVAEFISQKMKCNAHIAIDYLENENFVFLSFYQQEDIHFTQRLVVLNLEGEIQLDTILSSKLKGAGLESFMLWKDQLYFVKEKQKLVRVGLINV